MKMFFVGLMLLSLSPFAMAQNECGYVRNFSADPSGQPTYKVEFTDGTRLSDVVLRNGQEAFVVASMNGRIKLCFSLFNNKINVFSSITNY